MQDSDRARASLATTGPAPHSSRTLLIFAAIAVVVLQRFVPYGALLLYPFTLLATWVHEMGHGVTALLTSGRFVDLQIFADASGLAQTAVVPGWRQAAVCAGGLVAPSLVGAIFLALSRPLARALLWLLTGALLVSLLLWVRSAVGWAAMAPLLALCGAVAWRGGTGGRLFFAQWLGLLLGLDTVSRIGYFFVPAGQVGGRPHPSDIAGVAQALGGSYKVWGVLLAGLSLALLAAGLWAAFRTPHRRSV